MNGTDLKNNAGRRDEILDAGLPISLQTCLGGLRGVVQNLSALLLLALCFFPSITSAAEIPLTEWLTVSPFAVKTPDFSDSVLTAEQALSQQYLDYEKLQPQANDRLNWSPWETATWKTFQGETLTFPDDASLRVGHAAAYFTSDRWQKLKIKVKATRPVALFVDGKEEKSCSSVGDDSTCSITADFTAHSGKHCVILKFIDDDSLTCDWTVTASLEPDSGMEGSLKWSTTPKRALAHYKDWGLFEELGAPKVSSDGKWIAILHSKRDKEYKKDTWIEVFDTAGKLVRTIRMDTSPGNLDFLPKGQKLAFTISSDDKTTLWTYDFVTAEMTAALEGVKGFSRAEFSPDEKTLYYEVDEGEGEEKKDAAYELYVDIADEMYDYVDTKRLYMKSLSDGATLPLTETGKYSLADWRLSPNGEQMLIVRQIPRNQRPYSLFEFHVLNLKNMTSQLVDSRANIEVPSSFTWLSENSIAYALGSYDADPADTVFHNASNLDLFVLDLKTKTHKNLTGGTKYCVADEEGQRRIYWNPKDKNIWFHSYLGGYCVVLKVNPNGGEIKPALNTTFDFVDKPILSTDGSLIAYVASSTTKPLALYTQSPGGSEKLILDPNRELESDLIFGDMSEWDFTNEDGIRVEGWLYHPANFSANKKYPLIVYYYGGVSPRDVRFSFSYQWWLANGYCIYVLNPVGCSGYGQEFADLHANDWGLLATRDVIEGTTKILNEKSYLDREHIGAYGGSYGGFITLDLITRTDMFTAAVDMYGISNITSYFGGGNWGHWYGDIASPGSFPWSDRDIYVDRSPLYNADKINTPLLILHGGSDSNVPPIESEQMFKALKLLNKDVYYAEFAGEEHGIATKFKNYIEHREMMLEWFDKYLKDQPEAWNARVKSNED
jgi:dipeptidyl aminopeptidase/acylaminoacyl peptidase